MVRGGMLVKERHQQLKNWIGNACWPWPFQGVDFLLKMTLADMKNEVASSAFISPQI